MNYDLACAYALLAAAREDGDIEAAEDLGGVPSAKELREASIGALSGLLDSGFYRPTDLKLDPDLDPVRDSEAFQQLLRQQFIRYDLDRLARHDCDFRLFGLSTGKGNS